MLSICFAEWSKKPKIGSCFSCQKFNLVFPRVWFDVWVVGVSSYYSIPDNPSRDKSNAFRRKSKASLSGGKKRKVEMVFQPEKFKSTSGSFFWQDGAGIDVSGRKKSTKSWGSIFRPDKLKNPARSLAGRKMKAVWFDFSGQHQRSGKFGRIAFNLLFVRSILYGVFTL